MTLAPWSELVKEAKTSQGRKFHFDRALDESKVAKLILTLDKALATPPELLSEQEMVRCARTLITKAGFNPDR